MNVMAAYSLPYCHCDVLCAEHFNIFVAVGKRLEHVIILSPFHKCPLHDLKFLRKQASSQILRGNLRP